MSVNRDNFGELAVSLDWFSMDKWLKHARRHIEQGDALIQKGEEFITNSVSALFRDWQNPSIVIDKLCTGAERWQAAIRQTQAPINLADILRSRIGSRG